LTPPPSGGVFPHLMVTSPPLWWCPSPSSVDVFTLSVGVFPPSDGVFLKQIFWLSSQKFLQQKIAY
jgi:hypothetical protein